MCTLQATTVHNAHMNQHVVIYKLAIWHVIKILCPSIRLSLDMPLLVEHQIGPELNQRICHLGLLVGIVE